VSGSVERAVVDAIALTPARLAAACDPEAAALVQPDGEWGAAEIVRHLIAVEIEVHQRRLGDVMREVEPRWRWTEPGPWPGEPGASMTRLLELFREHRAATVDVVSGLDEAGWQRSGIHETFGRLDVAGLVREALAHDEEHLGTLLTARG
jgi:hypothetical protein